MLIGHAIYPGASYVSVFEEPVIEEIVIPGNHNKNTIDFTEINSISISKFSFITITTSNLQNTGSAGTGMRTGIQFSNDGGNTWIDAGDSYRGIGISASTAFIETQGVKGATLLRNAGTIHNFSAVISNLNKATPTHIQSQDMISSVPSRWDWVVQDAAIHDAIRIIVTIDGGGSRVYNGGNIFLVGYRTKGSEQIIDCSVNPQTEYFIDIPAGHTIANVYMKNINLSGNTWIRVQTSVAGTPDAGGSDYREHIMGATESSSALRADILVGMPRESGNHCHFSVWGFNTAAPMIFKAVGLRPSDGFPTDVRNFMGLRRSTTKYSQLRIFAEGNTFNSGEIFIQTYKAKTIILAEEDFGANPANVLNITGLTKGNATAFVLCSDDLGSAVSDFQRIQVLVNGVPDAGASDYTRTEINFQNDNVFLSGSMHPTPASGTSLPTAGLFFGIPIAAPTQVTGAGLQTGSGRWIANDRRDAAQVEDGLKVFTLSNNNWITGILYGVGYQL